MHKIVGLIQARMNSTRLPGKVMKDLAGKPLVRHIIDRLSVVAGLDEIILATTIDSKNDEMVRYAESLNINVYREENENDIVSRLVGAAESISADAILKINGDCPIVDVPLLERMLTEFNCVEDLDYLSNKIQWSFPKGLSAEIISLSSLQWCHENLTKENERELVCDWIRNNNRFKIQSYFQDVNLSHHDWMVDTEEDYIFMSKVFDALYEKNKLFGINEVLVWLEEVSQNI